MTPQEELAKLRRLAELEAKAKGGPLPGLGAPSTVNADRKDAQDFRQSIAPTSDVQSLAQGGLYGIGRTAIGIGQVASRVLPNVGQREYIDNLARTTEETYAQQPGSDSTAGRTGEFVGGTVATGPLAYLSIPAKGAGALSWLSRGAAGGGAMAGSQPVDGESFWSNKAAQAAPGAALGAGIPAVGRGVLSLAERTYAPNAMAQVSNVFNKGANKKPFAVEGEQLADRTRVPLTPAQVSGGKAATALENMTRQSVFSADVAFAADQKVADGAIKHINRMMDDISRNPASEAAVGTMIQQTTRGAVTKIAAQRDKIAAEQYGAIDKAVGNRPFVQPSATKQVADDLIAQYESVPSPEAARIVAQARALKEQLEKKGGFTLSEAQKARSYYGKATQGGASVFDDVSHDINRTIAKRIFGAMSDDIDASAQALSGGRGPGLVPAGQMDLGQALREANNNYRRYSQMIEGTKSHPIARLFGDKINVDDVMVFDKIPPEAVINRLGQMKPSELKMVRDFMEQGSPETWQQYKRLIVDRALESARTLPTSAGANSIPFNASQFIRSLGGDKPEKIKQLQAVFTADEFSQIDDAFNVARRLGDKFGANFSGTGPYMEVQGFLNSIKSRGASAIASTAGHAMGLRKIANVMFNAEGRRALIELSKVPPKSRQAASLVGLLASLAAGQELGKTDPQKNAGEQ